MKRKLLWVGDHSCSTGFAKASEATLKVLKKYFDIAVIAINYRGDPHPDYGYNVWPAWSLGGDMMGVRRIKELCDHAQPDIVVLQNDPWNIPQYLDNIPPTIPVVAAMAVDGLNFAYGRKLGGLSRSIFWTQFALNEARKGGFDGDADVIPLGVDLDIYSPFPQAEARAIIGYPITEGFFVGNINRNQPRKRLDLMVKYFCEWVKEYKIPDARLCLHVAPTGDKGWDLEQLMHYYGIRNRLFLFQPQDMFAGATDEWMRYLYCSFDVMATTTQGEGWGLPTLEGMACGIPQIVPDWSALGEWAAPAAIRVPCRDTSVTPQRINVVGGIVDGEAFVQALEFAYYDRVGLRTNADLSLLLAQEPKFRWENIGEQFAQSLFSVVGAPEVEARVG
jgi:D-inositol-3-phosphate glycosyltransferase